MLIVMLRYKYIYIIMYYVHASIDIVNNKYNTIGISYTVEY